MDHNSTEWTLIVVRKDGKFHSSSFSGWHGESASDKYFNEAMEDARTSFAVTFVTEYGEEPYIRRHINRITGNGTNS